MISEYYIQKKKKFVPNLKLFKVINYYTENKLD